MDLKRLRRRIRCAHPYIKGDRKSILRHAERHGIKEALLQMCIDEDALTIGAALLRTPSWRLNRALARVLEKRKTS
jgi:hypothetical protein